MSVLSKKDNALIPITSASKNAAAVVVQGRNSGRPYIELARLMNPFLWDQLLDCKSAGKSAGKSSQLKSPALAFTEEKQVNIDINNVRRKLPGE